MEYIKLNLGRTSATHSRCTFSNCETPKNDLRTIPREIRLKAIKTKKIFFPSGTRACIHHFLENNWGVHERNEKKFNRKQIEDLISLLSGSNNSNNDLVDLPGNLLFIRIYEISACLIRKYFFFILK